jgi:hypothetical protein
MTSCKFLKNIKKQPSPVFRHCTLLYTLGDLGRLQDYADWVIDQIDPDRWETHCGNDVCAHKLSWTKHINVGNRMEDCAFPLPIALVTTSFLCQP